MKKLTKKDRHKLELQSDLKDHEARLKQLQNPEYIAWHKRVYLKCGCDLSVLIPNYKKIIKELKAELKTLNS